MSALILILAILVVDKVYAKGGGGHASSHGSSSSKSSSKGSSSKSGAAKGGSTSTKTTSGVGKSVVIVGSGGQATQCHDSVTHQIVQCPVNRRRNAIIVAVVFGIIVAVFIGLMAWFFIRRRRRNQRQLADKTINLPFEASSKKEYQRLEDPT